MHPCRGNEYFVVLANKKVHIRALAVVERDVEKVLKAYPEMRVITSTLVRRDYKVTAERAWPSQKRRKRFLETLQTVRLRARRRL